MVKGKEVLVIGATQGTGLEASKILKSEGASVRVFARNIDKARTLLDDDTVIVQGDLTDPVRIDDALDGADHVIFTAGVTKRPCGEDLIVRTEFEGMKATLRAAKATGFSGSIAFLSSIGVTRSNWASRLLNKVKGNALVWRKEMEDLVRGSGHPYTIVRAGYLMNSGSVKPILFGQDEFRLEFKYRIGRKEAARVLVESLKHASASRKTFDAVRMKGASEASWEDKFADLAADSQRT